MARHTPTKGRVWQAATKNIANKNTENKKNLGGTYVLYIKK